MGRGACLPGDDSDDECWRGPGAIKISRTEGHALSCPEGVTQHTLSNHRLIDE
jgi:hypothetical protein